ncbi:hypothetical protein ACZ87_04026, partial [Candidatus Erwinia dacicola]
QWHQFTIARSLQQCPESWLNASAWMPVMIWLAC